MSTPFTTTGPDYPYLKVIDNYNRVVDDPKDDREGRVPESKLVKFRARDAGGTYRTFGYLTQHAMKNIRWLYWDFETVHGDDGIQALKEIGPQDLMSTKLLKPTAPRSALDFPFLSLCRQDLTPFLPLLGGPPEVRVSKYVSHLLGAARHEVHLTVESRHISNRQVEIWARKRLGTDIYPGKFEQALFTTIEHGEDEELALERLIGEHQDTESFRWSMDCPTPQKQVSYFTVGGEEAGQLAGVVDAGIISC